MLADKSEGHKADQRTNKTQDESTSHDLAVAFNLARQSRDKTPSDDEKAQVKRRAADIVEE